MGQGSEQRRRFRCSSDDPLAAVPRRAAAHHPPRVIGNRYHLIGDMEDSAESTVNPITQGCGPHTHISIHISPTTGGDFYLTVEPDITVENLKKLVSKKLKVPRDRICLLFRDK